MEFHFLQSKLFDQSFKIKYLNKISQLSKSALKYFVINVKLQSKVASLNCMLSICKIRQSRFFLYFCLFLFSFYLFSTLCLYIFHLCFILAHGADFPFIKKYIVFQPFNGFLFQTSAKKTCRSILLSLPFQNFVSLKSFNPDNSIFIQYNTAKRVSKQFRREKPSEIRLTD